MEKLEGEKSKVFPIYIVDAFTKHPFSGNPAAVCLIPFGYDVEDEIKQKIAAEMNLSETAFPKILNETESFQSGQHFSLRWFTPACEVSLCGHATLATAAVLLDECKNKSEVIEFETLCGVLKAVKAPNNRIQIDLPAYESHPVNGEYDRLVKAVAKDLPVQEVVLSSGPKNLVIRLCDTVTRKEFESFKINPSELLSTTDYLTGVIVTLKGSDEEWIDEEGNHYDFVSRYFAPWCGITEDPVTGSAHNVLAPYWAKILHKDKFYARQCSRRGGELHIEILDDRVLLTGGAAVVVKGQIHV